MKKCPFCAEQIQDEAIKCRYCGEFLDKRIVLLPPRPTASAAAGKGQPWYQSTATIVIALCCLGPLALPLVWANPRYKPVSKIVVTLATLLLTYWMCKLTVQVYQNLMHQMQALKNM